MKELTRDHFQHRMCADNNGRNGSYTIRKKIKTCVGLVGMVTSRSPKTSLPKLMFADRRRNSTPRIND